MNYIYQDKLETARLTTRMLEMEDIATWADFFTDKEVLEFLPAFGDSTNLEISKFWIEKQLNRYENNKYGLQALIDKKTNNFIGQCGLLSQEVEGKTEIEVGYHIFKKFWGQGYASEAAKAFIDYAFNNNLTNSVISIIDVRNVKSQRVAEKNGLVQEKKIIWSNLDVYVYRITNTILQSV